jgi:hypothetical protein
MTEIMRFGIRIRVLGAWACRLAGCWMTIVIEMIIIGVLDDDYMVRDKYASQPGLMIPMLFPKLFRLCRLEDVI